MSAVCSNDPVDWLTILNHEVVACRRCPRLVTYREEVARVKRRAYLSWDYWGKPVPGFGDPHARVLIMGLAPGAHGSNRTGRPFTGDASGNFMYPVLYETGFASQPTAIDRNDGMQLKDLYITAAVRCAPPDNKPLPQELAACSSFLDRELAGLTDVRVVVALGKIGFDAYLNYVKRQGTLASKKAFCLPARCQVPDARWQSAIGVLPSFKPEHADWQAYPQRCSSRSFKKQEELPMEDLRRRWCRLVPIPHDRCSRKAGARTAAAPVCCGRQAPVAMRLPVDPSNIHCSCREADRSVRPSRLSQLCHRHLQLKLPLGVGIVDAAHNH